ncbi:MAG: hypothetical protein OK438_01185 [Thaumarchaeota archaeon]|nr:hypothetical protein [Nitrososphaerota archaeon]
MRKSALEEEIGASGRTGAGGDEISLMIKSEGSPLGKWNTAISLPT